MRISVWVAVGACAIGLGCSSRPLRGVAGVEGGAPQPGVGPVAGIGGAGGGASDAAASGDDGGQGDEDACSLGEAMSHAAADSPDEFAVPVFLNGGVAVPAGRYRVSYVDGCMKYSGTQGWAVNAYDETGCCNWWIVGETSFDRKIEAPGTIGFLVGQGGFQDFDACVNANRAIAPRTFEHAGGRLAIWLADSPYGDNLPGLDGRNPKWRIDRLASCAAP